MATKCGPPPTPNGHWSEMKRRFRQNNVQNVLSSFNDQIKGKTDTFTHIQRKIHKSTSIHFIINLKSNHYIHDFQSILKVC